MEKQPLRRRRPALSCIACRQRKIKCSRTDPCARCVSNKIQCVYRAGSRENTLQQPLRRSDIIQPTSSRAIAASPVVPSARFELTVRQDAQQRALDANHESPVTPSGTPGSHNRDTIVQDSADRDAIIPRVSRVSHPSASRPDLGLSETSRKLLTAQAGLRESEILLKKTRVLRWSDWMGTAPQFKTVYNVVQSGGLMGGSSKTADLGALATEVEDLMLKCKRIAKSLKVSRPSRSLSSPRPRLDPPPREVADAMATIYFRSFEPIHRILHEPSFWREYERFWDNAETATTGSRLKILLVIGLGAALCEETGPDTELRSMIQQWVYTAQAWLAGPLEKDRLDLPGLQIHCLTILARQVYSVGGDLVWMSIGSLVNAAMQIGLHRDPKYLPSMPLLQAEIRRRLWYTIVEMVAQSSLDAAMTPRMTFDDFDTEVPSNINDDEINESSTALLPRPKGVYTTTSIQIALVDSLPTRLQIVELLSGLHAELTYEEVLILSAELTERCREVNAIHDKDPRMTPFHRNFADLLVRRFMIPLHFTFASEALRVRLFAHSQSAALDAALNLISPESDAHFARLMAMGGGMFKEAQRCAHAIITMQLLSQVEEQRRDGTLRRNTQHLDLLRKATEKLATQSWERIRLGETNIKGAVLLGMILVFVDNRDPDESAGGRQRRMAECARDSLVLGRDLLRERADALSLPSPSNNDSLTSGSLGDEVDGFGLDFDLDFLFQGIGYNYSS